MLRLQNCWDLHGSQTEVDQRMKGQWADGQLILRRDTARQSEMKGVYELRKAFLIWEIRICLVLETNTLVT